MNGNRIDHVGTFASPDDCDGRVECFERGLELFRNHEFAAAAELWSQLTSVVEDPARDTGLPAGDLDLYVKVARRESLRLASFVQARSDETDELCRVLQGFAASLDIPDIAGSIRRGAGLMRDGLFSEALEAFEAALEAGVEDHSVYLGAARSCIGLARLHDALEYAEAAAGCEPVAARTCSLLGTILLELDRGRKAEEYFKSAVELDSRDAWAWFGLASLYHEDGRLDLAESCVRKCLSLQPGWIAACSLLDEVLKAHAETGAMIGACKAVLDEHPDYADWHHRLGLCLLSRGEYDRAVKCFDRALEINPRLVKTIVQRANVFLIEGRFTDSCSEFRRAAVLLEEAGRPAPADLGTAHGLFEKGRYEEAAWIYADAVTVEPDYATRHIESARKFLDIGLIAQAVHEAKEAVRLAPDYADGYFVLGKSQRLAGRVDEARRALEAALGINPFFDEARREMSLVSEPACREKDKCVGNRDEPGPCGSRVLNGSCYGDD